MTRSSDSDIDRAVEILRGGGLVALPTETVYGLAADAENELAVRRIFAVKGRPQSHPLIVHLADPGQWRSWVRELPDPAARLADAFWPGPLTLVLRRTGRASDAVTGGQDTVALRVPAHPLARELLHAFGGGLAAPSANRFGRVSPTSAAHVRQDLGNDVDLVLDGGPCSVGVESTIVDVSAGVPALLRPGGVGKEALEQVLGHALTTGATGAVRAPGLLPSHYAPRAGVVVAPPGEVASVAAALLAEGKQVAVLSDERSRCPEGAVYVPIPHQATELAQRLYALLREVDASGVEVMVMQLPEAGGLGLALQDRLRRAAAPRG